jgi:hypothetical protein
MLIAQGIAAAALWGGRAPSSLALAAAGGVPAGIPAAAMARAA